MSALRWDQRPNLNRPVLVAAFAGWNDAGDAASGAVRYLASQWRGREFASIDPEDFFDFTTNRPVVRLDDGMSRDIEWPTNRLTAAAAPAGPTDVVFLHGVEPQLKWRTFCDAILQCASEINASAVITLGGLLADVPHTRPAPVSAHSTDPVILERHSLRPSIYEGPTGVVGVLHHACAQAGMAATSLWVSVPHYVGQTPSPKATMALVHHAADLLDAPIDTVDLEIASAAYEQQVSEVVEADEDMAQYVSELEDDEDEEIHGDSLAAEAERFLRDQGE